MKAIKKHLKEHNPDRVEAFEKGAAVYVKKILGNFKDYDCVRLSLPSSSPFWISFSTSANP